MKLKEDSLLMSPVGETGEEEEKEEDAIKEVTVRLNELRKKIRCEQVAASSPAASTKSGWRCTHTFERSLSAAGSSCMRTTSPLLLTSPLRSVWTR